MTLTSQLISTCFQRLPGQIDEGALRMARLSLIDSLAVAYAAYGERPIDMLRSLSTEGQTEGESTVIGYGERGRATDVSLVNGMMISLQLFDDNHELMRGHPLRSAAARRAVGGGKPWPHAGRGDAGLCHRL